MTEHDYIEKTDKICGEFLRAWKPVEYGITLTIARYYCQDMKKLYDLDTFIDNTKGMKTRIAALKHILTKLNIPDKAVVSNFIKSVEKNYELRNCFAHYIIDVPKNRYNRSEFNFKSQGKYNLNQDAQIVGHYNMKNHDKTMRELQKIVIYLVALLKRFEDELKLGASPPSSRHEHEIR
jgi:hypothetical protein